MPYIRHHAVITSEDGDVEHSVTAYEETPFGLDELSTVQQNSYANVTHDQWVEKTVTTGWEIVDG